MSNALYLVIGLILALAPQHANARNSSQKSGPMSKALRDNFDSYYSNAKKSGFRGGSVSKESTVSGFNQMNSKLAAIKQQQFSQTSKERYKQYDRDVADGKIKSHGDTAQKEGDSQENTGTYNTSSGSPSQGRGSAPTTGMTAGASGGAKIVTFGAGNPPAAEPKESKNPE